jgi:hypothetical protein
MEVEEKEYGITEKGKMLIDLKRVLEMTSSTLLNKSDDKTIREQLLMIRQGCNKLEKTLEGGKK